MTTKIAFWLVAVVSFTSLMADPAVKKPRRPNPQLASMMPSFELTKKDEVVKFISCETENECYRSLQEIDLSSTTAGKSGEGFSLVAEFVESPKKGIMVYKRKTE